MERRFFLLPLCSLLIAAAFLMTSCGKGGSSLNRRANNLTLDTILFESRHHLEGDTANPYCDIRLQFIYPVNSDDTNLDTLQHYFVTALFGTAYEDLQPAAAVEEYVRNYVDNYTRDAAIYRETAGTTVKQDDLMQADTHDHDHEGHSVSDSFYSYYESISDTILYNHHGIISFQVRQSNNKGGAASYQLCRNHVFNLKRGAPVAESDLFNAGYDTALRHILIASLLEQNGVKSIEALEELGFFGIREILPNRNFLLNDEGIIYTFNKGEYSAYQLDAPEIMIPYGSVRSLLRENSVASKLADLK
jgi:hypothetical protein